MAYQVIDRFSMLRTVCEIIGIDPDKHPVTSIRIEIPANDAVRVTIERLLHEVEAKAICATLSVHELHPVDLDGEST